MTMLISALQPLRLRVRKFNFQTRDDYPMFLGGGIPIKAEHLNLSLELRFSLVPRKDLSDTKIGFVATIGLALVPDESPEAADNVFTKVELVSDAFFSVPDEVLKGADLEAMLHNMFLMLYGAMRGQLQVLSSLVPGTFLVLPGIDLLSILRSSGVGHKDNLVRLKSDIEKLLGSGATTAGKPKKAKARKV